MTDHCLEESRGLSGETPQGLPACPPPSAECLERSWGGLSLNHLKAVAVAAMVIDHIAFAFVPDGTLLAILLHSIGKITGPTMFFAAVEGCHHTRNLNRYLLRLAVFALVSWFPFLYFHFGGDLAAIQLMRPNVIYTIFLGVLAVRIRRSPRLCSAWKVLLILLLFILSVPADWGYTGVVIILVFDYYYGSWKHQAFAYCMVVMLDMGVLSLLIHPFFGLFYDHVFQIDWELYAYSVEYVGAFLPLLLLSRENHGFPWAPRETVVFVGAQEKVGLSFVRGVISDVHAARNDGLNLIPAAAAAGTLRGFPPGKVL